MEKYLVDVKEIITVEGVGRYYFNLLVRNVNFQLTNAEREKSAGISNPPLTKRK
jgi:hypothetical protein